MLDVCYKVTSVAASQTDESIFIWYQRVGATGVLLRCQVGQRLHLAKLFNFLSA